MKSNIKFVIFMSIFSLSLSSCENFKKEDDQNKKTIKKDVKIIATLGKKGWNKIPEFYESGANIFRINGSHIKSEEMMKETLEGVMKVLKDDKYKDADIMYDTQGPEIRVLIPDKRSKQNEEASYEIQSGDVIYAHTNLNDKEIVFTTDIERTNNERKQIHIGVNYKDFVEDIYEGMILTIENRTLYAKVNEIDKTKGIVRMIVVEVNTKDGKYNLTDRRHINLIGNNVSLPTLTENDKKYIKMSALAGVKYYAISFVRDDKDIDDVKKLIKNCFIENGFGDKEITQKMKNIKIIAKIETKQGLDNIDSIMQKAEGSMVARGDLASEIPMEAVPYAKIDIINTSNKYNKFSILATDVLESLTRQEIVSRNDVDVVVLTLQLNVDAIMLSNETAQGEKGTKIIKILKKIIDYDKNRK